VLKLIIEDDEGRKTVVPFVRDEITIGRQEGNTIRLTERNVSRRHARLFRQNGHIAVEDLGSYNGIRLNGDKISGQTTVHEGDLIQIADYDLSVQSDAVTQTAPSAQAHHAPSHSATMPVTAAAPRSELTTLRLDGATKPALPPIESPSSTLADDDGPEEAHPDDVTAAPTSGENATESTGPARNQSTAVIHMDAVEGSRTRKVVDLDPSEAPRLVVLNTEFAGREFACIRTELRVGRTDDNDIAIDHRSLSRTHCKVVREDTGEWRVLDMESANGLMVNGETYAQATLRSGDVIELGHVKIKFVGPGEAFTLTQTSDGVKVKTGSRAPMIAGGVVVLALVAGGAWFMMQKSQQRDQTGSGHIVELQPGVAPVVKPPEPIAVAKPVDPTPPEPVKVPDPEPVKPPEPVVVKQPDPEPEPAKPTRQESEEEAILAQQKLNAATIAKAEEAIMAGELKRAEELLSKCKVAGSPCPEAKAKLDKIRAEKQFKVLLDKADRAIAEKKLILAGQLMSEAYPTEVFQPRHRELESRLKELMSQEMLKKSAPPDVVAAKTQPAPPPKPEPAPTPAKASETEKLVTEARDHIKKLEYPQAKTKLNNCIKVEPANAVCHKLLGSTYAFLKDNKKGVLHYKKFIELAPDDPSAAKVKGIIDAYESNQPR
jgi:ABC transport system ATP-binding/permease protein